MSAIRKILLFPFGVLYHGVTSFRNILFDKEILKSTSFDLPIICIGNLAVGGTGKTPHTEYLIRLLRKEYQVATLSRGYGRKTKDFREVLANSSALEVGDEPAQYKRKFPNVIVAVENDRVRGVNLLLHRYPDLEVILLDDAFQHRKIVAGLNIVISDYNRPLKNDYLLPAGNLREHKKNINRADMVIISKCPKNLSLTERNKLTSELNFHTPENVFFTAIRYGAIYSIFTPQQKIETLKDVDVLLVSGIARPKGLQAYVRKRAKSIKIMEYKDHHNFSRKDIQEIKDNFNLLNSKKKIILTTEKDASRFLSIEDMKSLPVYSIEIEVFFLDKQNEFNTQIVNYVKQNKRNS